MDVDRVQKVLGKNSRIIMEKANGIDNSENRVSLYQAMDKIRDKCGDRLVIKAAGLLAYTIGRGNPFNGEAPPLLANRKS